VTSRARQRLGTAIALLFVVAVVVAWGGYLHARSTPRWQQTAPGAPANPETEGGMPMRLVSLTVSPVLVTDTEANSAPAGALWVIAVLEYEPPPEGSYCNLDLLAVDGRRWRASSQLDYDGQRPLNSGCLSVAGAGVPRSELLYLIPSDAAGSLAGLVTTVTGYRGTAAHPVLTPPG
jgi:hypothetical protein